MPDRQPALERRLAEERGGQRLDRRRQDAVRADVGPRRRVRRQVPRRPQGDGDGRPAGRQHRLGQLRLRRLEVRGERADDDEVERGAAARRGRRCRRPPAAAGRRISSTSGSRRRSAAPGVGAHESTTCRPASGRRAATGRPRSARRRPAAGAAGRSSSRTSVIDRGRARRPGPGARGTPTTSSGGWSKPPSHRRSSSSRRVAAASSRGVDQAAPLGLRDALLEPLQRRLVGRAEQQVLAGAQGDDGIDDLRRPLGQGAHVQGVGDGHALEAELSRSRSRRIAGRQAGRQRRRPSAPARDRWPAMTSRAPASSAARNGTSSRSLELGGRPATTAARGGCRRPCRRHPGSA